MKIYLSLLMFLTMTASMGFAQQNINPARLYEQQRGTQPPVEGVWHVYDRNGKLLREENYHNYRLDGEMKIFYPSGNLKELLHYSDGLREGNDKTYFESGGLESEDTYVDNDLQGPSVHYYDTGEVKSREHYADGKLDGEKTILYKSGILRQSMYYQNGVLDGAVSTYAENGQILVDEHYIHGTLISHNEYGDKSTYVSKNDSASNAAAPTPNNAPAPADMPTEIMISLNTDYLKGFVSAEDFNVILPSVRHAHENLHNHKGLGAEYTGWLDLPSRIPDALIKEINALAYKVRQNSDCHCFHRYRRLVFGHPCHRRFFRYSEIAGLLCGAHHQQ